MGGVGKWDEAGDAVRSVIRAYHGSPYDFDRFDASKIGTGEGAQSYGHGLYFAGNEAVARDYRDRLKDLVDRPAPEELGDELQAIIREVRGLAERRKSAVGEEWHALDRALEDAHVRHQDVQHRIREASYNPGHIYEVEIGHPEQSLLDYDATLASQPDHVRAILPSLNLPLDDATAPTLKMAYGFEKPENITGREIQSALRRNEMAHRGIGWSQREAAASRTLADAGIPGVRYLDQGSRAAGGGTRNYVIFPGAEDSIRILRKFAVPGAVGAGAAAMQGEQ